jgi:CheY-like chemotaxis protein
VVRPTEPVPRPEAEAVGATVLLVEDNAEVAEVCRGYLEQLGYEVAYAAQARDALAMLERGEPVDLVLSDILMPGGMSGLDLARILRQRYPALPVVLITGYSGSASEAIADRFAILRKPFDLVQLADQLVRALQQGERLQTAR